MEVNHWVVRNSDEERILSLLVSRDWKRVLGRIWAGGELSMWLRRRWLVHMVLKTDFVAPSQSLLLITLSVYVK